MTFLYSSLSILFLSGIILISKHATLFTTINSTEYLENSYKSSKYQITDRYILNLLYKNELKDQDDELCYSLKQKLLSSGFIGTSDKEYFVFNNSSSSHPLLINSCVLSDGNHRILIKSNPSNQNIYNLNTCVADDKYICSFEED